MPVDPAAPVDPTNTFAQGVVAPVTQGGLPGWQFQAPSAKGPVHTYTSDDQKVPALSAALADLGKWRTDSGPAAA